MQRGMRILFLFLVCFALLAFASPARADRFGDIDFRVPSGWRKVENGGFAILAAPSDAHGRPQAAIFVTGGSDYRGDFGDWFAATVRQGESGETSISRGAVLRIQARGDYDALTIDSVTRDVQGTTTHRKYVAANPGGRAELFVFITYSDRAAQQYLPELREFLESVRYVQLGGVRSSLRENARSGTASTPPPTRPSAGSHCRVVTRQQCLSGMSGGFGGTMTPIYNCLPVSKTICD
jgi:hypothetical protein